jgi:hypothetical protein
VNKEIEVSNIATLGELLSLENNLKDYTDTAI